MSRTTPPELARRSGSSRRPPPRAWLLLPITVLVACAGSSDEPAGAARTDGFRAPNMVGEAFLLPKPSAPFATTETSWRDASPLPLPARFPTATLLPTGQVIIAGGDVLRAGVWTLYDPATGAFVTSGVMAHARERHTATLLSDGRVLLAGGYAGDAPSASAELFDPATGSLTPTGSMGKARWKHAAALLPSGKVLMAGGVGNGTLLADAELFDPSTGTFSSTAQMLFPRNGHTLTLLASGEVLVAGGRASGGTSNELYDEQSGAFKTAGSMARARRDHTATLLPDGRVLVVGGSDTVSDLATAEVYDLASDSLSAVGDLADRRSQHTATMLPDGLVMIAGGKGATEAVASVERYDPRTGTFVAGASLGTPRAAHAAILLPSGKVLLAGGGTVGSTTSSTELYDPGWARAAYLDGMTTPRYAHSATRLAGSGKVLITGGYTFQPQPTAELYDPASRSFTLTGAPIHGAYYATATSLASGDVLLTGGARRANSWLLTAGMETYRAESGTFADAGSLGEPRAGHSATLLHDDTVLLLGGDNGMDAFAEALRYDPVSQTLAVLSPLMHARTGHTATVLPDGDVIVAGGATQMSLVGTLERFRAQSNTLVAAGELAVPRSQHRAVLVAGAVVSVGGLELAGDSLALVPEVERYDPDSETSVVIGVLQVPRWGHSATLLGSSGIILVAGGSSSPDPNSTAVASVELFDTQSGTSMLLDAGFAIGTEAAAVELESGQILLTGGIEEPSVLVRSAALFDPATRELSRTWGIFNEVRRGQLTVPLPSGALLVAGGGSPVVTDARVLDWVAAESHPTGPMQHPRAGATACLIDEGHVLVAGGAQNGPSTASAEVYDIHEGTFRDVGAMTHGRQRHTSTRLPSGQVLITGGQDESYAALATAEVFDPATSAFRSVGPMFQARYDHGAALLPSGKVLVTGGKAAGDALSVAAEVFDPAAETFSVAETHGLTGRVRAAALFGGAVLVAGDSTAYVVDSDSDSFEFLTNMPLSPFAIVPSVQGEAMVCGEPTCARFDPALRTTSGTLATGAAAGWSSAASLPSGGALILTQAFPEAAGYGVELTRLPPGASPSRIDTVELDTIAGATSITIHGAGFTRSPSPGSKGQSSSPPLIQLMPDAGGGPITLRTVSWTDSLLTAIVPGTAYHGPGRVHVVVDGVASEGRFLMLPPAARGAPCSYAAHCGSGFCVDGRCCDTACDGPCVTCSAADQAAGGLDGTCAAAASGSNPRGACELDSADSCQRTGVCDGQGQCAIYDDGTVCRTSGTCEKGVCLRCNEAGDAVLAGESRISCAPFACRGGGCLDHCTTALDCAAGHTCSDTGTCVPFLEAPAPEDPGACSARALPQRGRAEWLSLALAATWISIGLRARKGISRKEAS